MKRFDKRIILALPQEVHDQLTDISERRMTTVQSTIRLSIYKYLQNEIRKQLEANDPTYDGTSLKL